MCYAGNCNPACDNCKPKYLVCPRCKDKALLSYRCCPACGLDFTEEMRERARDEWHAAHPYSSGA